MSSNAKADPVVTPRLKSAVLWGVVGALFFLVLHQAYLLMDGQFLGVGPVAAVAVAVFLATVVASYFTAGHLEVFEPDEATVEASDTRAPGPVTVPESESGSASATERASESEPEATEPVADESVSDDAEDDGTTDGESDDDASDAEDEWIWGDQDG